MNPAVMTIVKKKTERNWTLWISILFLVALVGSYFAIPGFRENVNEAFIVITSEDEPRIKAWVKTLGIVGPLFLITAMTVQMFMLVIPNLLLFIIAIICYGPVWGSLICLTGVAISTSLGYMLGRNLGAKALDKFVSQKVQDKISAFTNRYGFKAIAIARMSSLLSDGLGFAAGILEMDYKKFMIATLAGITPVIVLIAIFGKNGNVEKSLFWIAGISLAVLIGYIIVDRRKQHAKPSTD